MATSSTRPTLDVYSARMLCRIVAIACFAGFLLDMLILALPPNVTSIEWRIGFLQQMGDRSIILLFGAALFMFGSLESRRWLRRTALFCLIIGVIFHLSCILVIRDSLTLQKQALSVINQQADQVQSQIQQRKTNPGTGENAPTLDQLQRASQTLSNQVKTLKENTQQSILKTGFSSVANLIVVGLALISLGRYGMRFRRGTGL